MRFLVTLLLAMASAAHALHQESPGVLPLTNGPAHQASPGRAWGNWVAFASTQDLAGLGVTRVAGPQIFVFNLAYYDCAQGTTFPATPCPPPGTPYLVQVTNGVGDPANPSVSQIPSGSTQLFDVWVAFDALGSYAANPGAASSRRQIFLKNLATSELRQVTMAGDGDSTRPSVSGTAGVVTFESTAMLAGFPNPAAVTQVFLYERTTGVMRQLSLGPPPGSVVPLGPSRNAMPNEGGDGIAFESTADLLGTGTDTGISQIFWADYDRPSHVSTLRQVTAGNAPSRNPFAGNAPKVVVFDSEATNLPGAGGSPGRQIFEMAITTPPATTVTRLTTSAIFGDCSVPALEPNGTRVGFVCTGDPLQNFTGGPRLFVLDRQTTTLYQITGLGAVEGRPAMNLGQWFVTVATSSDLTSGGNCTTQLYVVDYLAGRWDAATLLGQYPEDVTTANACGGTCTTAADCDDANPCNGVETCGPPGVCLRGAPIVCTDGNVCNGVETCNPGTGLCVAGAPLTCNDANPCTDDACQPAAGCVVTPNTASCDDGNACTSGDVCADGQCGGALLPCPTCERCEPSSGMCISGPRTTCDTDANVRATLKIGKGVTTNGNLLSWKWKRATAPAAAFGDPLVSDDYAVCIYDGTNALVLRADAPAANGCGAGSCWTAKSSGFVYRDRTATPSGLLRLLLKSKPSGGAKITAKGRGVNLDVPVPSSLALPIRTQLQNPLACWDVEFAAPHVKRKDATQLKAKRP